MKRGTSGLSGVIALDKPAGITSHDVVNRVRRITAERRVGHAGTLDPAATGLMLVCVGPATRLSRYLTGHDKAYRARIMFGARTDTDDLDGRVIGAVEPAARDEALEHLEKIDPAEVLGTITGEQMQLPPAYSAIKKNGTVAYKAAREGSEIELEPRPVTVYAAHLVSTGHALCDLAVEGSERLREEQPYWDVDLHVSKGTYIRAIARDLGVQLGCGAYLASLRRMLVGETTLASACSLDQLEERAVAGELPWLDPVSALGLPHVRLSKHDAASLANGRRLACPPELQSAPLAACSFDSRLLAVCRVQGGQLVPETVLSGGVGGVR